VPCPLGQITPALTAAPLAFVEASGGVRPPVRHRPVRHLSLVEREEISRGVAAGESLRVLARRLGRAPSTLSREVARNGGRHQYRAHRADRAAWQRARRSKACKLASNQALRAVVEELLADRWSPQQIAGRLRRTYPDDEEMHVSHETIYLSLFIQARGGLKRELTQHLRTRRANRRPKGARPPSGKGRIVDPVMISERPADVEDRAVPGHWEGDLIMGKRQTAIDTLVERWSRYVMLFPLPDGKNAESVRVALETNGPAPEPPVSTKACEKVTGNTNALEPVVCPSPVRSTPRPVLMNVAAQSLVSSRPFRVGRCDSCAAHRRAEQVPGSGR